MEYGKLQVIVRVTDQFFLRGNNSVKYTEAETR